MEKQEHTPGPWMVDASRKGVVIDQECGEIVATCGANIHGAPEANARLIAARAATQGLR